MNENEKEEMEKEPEEKMVETQQPETENSETELKSEGEPEINSVDVSNPEPEAEPEPKSVSEPEPVVEEERRFTQAEVDKLVGKIRNEARERGKKEALDELLNKYGYDDVSQLDDTVGESERYAGRADEYEALKNENLLLRAGVDEDRFEDALAYFAYKKMPINPITLEEAIEAHPEWTGFGEYDASNANEDEEVEEKPSVVRRLGAEPIRKNDNPTESEEERAMRIMGLWK